MTLRSILRHTDMQRIEERGKVKHSRLGVSFLELGDPQT